MAGRINPTFRAAAEHSIQTVASHIAVAFPGVPIVAVANPYAGTGARRRALVRIVRALRPPSAPAELRAIHWTEDVAAARERVANACLQHSGAVVCISFGGDGTHNELMSSFVGDDRVLFYRLPAGTGNDAVGSDLASVLHSATVADRPQNLGAIEVRTRSERFYAFNIASVGLDAYITATRNRLKSFLPGNAYRLVTDISVLSYERIVGLTDSALWIDGVAQPKGRRMLVAMGVDAPRTYGDHMLVLPGADNVCEIGPVTMRKRVRLKRLFLAGRHVAEPEVTMHRASQLTMEYERSLPIQMDGEAVWLAGNQFPLGMKTLPSSVQVVDVKP